MQTGPLCRYEISVLRARARLLRRPSPRTPPPHVSQAQDPSPARLGPRWPGDHDSTAVPPADLCQGNPATESPVRKVLFDPSFAAPALQKCGHPAPQTPQRPAGRLPTPPHPVGDPGANLKAFQGFTRASPPGRFEGEPVAKGVPADATSSGQSQLIPIHRPLSDCRSISPFLRIVPTSGGLLEPRSDEFAGDLREPGILV